MPSLKKTKNVETITAKLHSTVAELESHADDQLEKASIAAEVAASATALRADHLSEHERATTVASNIRTLLGN